MLYLSLLYDPFSHILADVHMFMNIHNNTGTLKEFDLLCSYSYTGYTYCIYNLTIYGK